MKHQLSLLLEGMEISKSEHDWMEQRLKNMTVKEELFSQAPWKSSRQKTFRQPSKFSRDWITVSSFMEQRMMCYWDDLSWSIFIPHARGTALS